MYLSEEDIEVELRENLEKDSISGFSVNISDIETDGNNDNNTDFQGQASEDAEVEFKKKRVKDFDSDFSANISDMDVHGNNDNESDFQG